MLHTKNALTPPSGVTPQLELAHILFMDMVGYSLLSMEAQAAYMTELQEMVRRDPTLLLASSKNEVLCRPAGDGMAIIFFRDVFAPLNCAANLAVMLKKSPYIRLRMGIHSGPVFVVRDINHIADVQGDGIVTAQRVMNCGDTGHILLSNTVAEMIRKTPYWMPLLQEIGTCRIKHNESVHLYNLVAREFGNRDLPQKVKKARAGDHRREALRAVGHNIKSVLRIAATVGIFGFGLWKAAPYIRQHLEESTQLPQPPSPAGSKVVGTDNVQDKHISGKTDRNSNPSPRPLEAGTTAVPDTKSTHLSLDEARQAINDAHLTPVRRYCSSDEIEKGYVVEQSIDPGKPVRKGTSVQFFLSTGPDPHKPASESINHLEFEAGHAIEDNGKMQMAGDITLPEGETEEVTFAFVQSGKQEEPITHVDKDGNRFTLSFTGESETIRIRAYNHHKLIGESLYDPNIDGPMPSSDEKVDPEKANE